MRKLKDVYNTVLENSNPFNKTAIAEFNSLFGEIERYEEYRI